jgi:hypothetical protein
MKKMIALITLIIALSCISANSQTLQNTTWSMYFNTIFISYCHFSADTFSASQDNITWKNVSTFQVNGNEFRIVDLTNDDCTTIDTGSYTFSIQNDVLTFTLISDNCNSRVTGLSLSTFNKIETSIQNKSIISDLKLYPNPADDEVIIQSNNDVIGSTYIISDQLGRQVLSGILSGESTKVDINQLTPGLYYLQIGGNNKQIYKLIKK